MESQENQRHRDDTEKHDINAEEPFDHEASRNQDEDPGVLEDIGRHLDQSLAGNSQGVKAYIGDLKLIYDMLRASDFAIDKGTKIALIIGVLYVISPIDFIPDGIPFLGVLDDVLVAGYAIKRIATELERYRTFKRDVPQSAGT